MVSNRHAYNLIVSRIQRNDVTLAQVHWVRPSVSFLSFGVSDDDIIPLARALETNTSLQGLLLNCNKITDRGLQTLCQGLGANRSLVHLGLEGNAITTEGMHALCEVIKHHPSLRQLNLSVNRLGDEGIGLLCEALEVNRNITELGLRLVGMTDKGLKQLCATLVDYPQMHQLDVQSNHQLTEDCAFPLAELLVAHKKTSGTMLASDFNKDRLMQFVKELEMPFPPK
eukprot:m.50584 g.50584  ORF g.50584 m.50584 type:complete len:227 (-) comp12162_c0_seq2:206-886(-)